VERRPKGASLTDAGREIARRGDRILKEVRDIADYARQAGKPFAAPIKLGVIPTVAPYVLPPLLPLLRAKYPQLDLHVRETHTQQLIAELIDGTLDLLLLALPVEHPEVETIKLIETASSRVPPDREVHRRIRATADLANDRLLLRRTAACDRAQACQLRRSTASAFDASSLSRSCRWSQTAWASPSAGSCRARDYAARSASCASRTLSPSVCWVCRTHPAQMTVEVGS
jgi:LysR family hydrogen peroxide-inducible transcriptional activator